MHWFCWLISSELLQLLYSFGILNWRFVKFAEVKPVRVTLVVYKISMLPTKVSLWFSSLECGKIVGYRSAMSSWNQILFNNRSNLRKSISWWFLSHLFNRLSNRRKCNKWRGMPKQLTWYALLHSDNLKKGLCKSVQKQQNLRNNAFLSQLIRMCL